MNLTLTEEQEMLKKTARDFLTDKCPKTFVTQMEESEAGYSRIFSTWPYYWRRWDAFVCPVPFSPQWSWEVYPS